MALREVVGRFFNRRPAVGPNPEEKRRQHEAARAMLIHNIEAFIDEIDCVPSTFKRDTPVEEQGRVLTELQHKIDLFNQCQRQLGSYDEPPQLTNRLFRVIIQEEDLLAATPSVRYDRQILLKFKPSPDNTCRLLYREDRGDTLPRRSLLEELSTPAASVGSRKLTPSA